MGLRPSGHSWQVAVAREWVRQGVMGEGPLPAGQWGLPVAVPRPPWRERRGDSPWLVDRPPSLPPPVARAAAGDCQSESAFVASMAMPRDTPPSSPLPPPPPPRGGRRNSARPSNPPPPRRGGGYGVPRGVWCCDPRPCTLGGCHRSPGTVVPPRWGLLHPRGHATQCHRPMGAGALGPHGARWTRSQHGPSSTMPGCGPWWGPWHHNDSIFSRRRR